MAHRTEIRYSDYSSIETFDQNGPNNYSDLFNNFNDAYSIVEEDAGYILTENLQDRSFRSALSLAGWKPGQNMHAQALEWWEFDWEYGQSPVGTPVSLEVSLTNAEGVRNKAPKNLQSLTTYVS